MSSKKNILFIEFHPLSGSSTGLVSQIRYLHNNLPDKYNFVVVTSPNSIFRYYQKELNYILYERRAVELTDLCKLPLQTILTYFKIFVFVLFISIKHNIHLIHCYHYSWSIYANPVGYLLRKPVIIHLKDVWLLEPKFARILMKFNPHSSYIAVSKYVYNLFTKKYKIDALKTITIYDGIDGNIFKKIDQERIERKYNNSFKIIAMMSRLNRERDIEVFIDTAGLLIEKYPSLKFIHYGYSYAYSDKEYYKFLDTRVKSLKLENCFYFKEYQVEQKKVAQILQNSFLTVVPARQFALPNVAIESMMCSVPVIAYNVGGNREIIKHNKNGILIESNSSILFARNIERYLTNKRKYLHNSLMAAKNSRQIFSAEINFGKVDILYNKLIN